MKLCLRYGRINAKKTQLKQNKFSGEAMRRGKKITTSVFFGLLLCSISNNMYSQLPEQDCLGAIRVCQNTYVQTNAYSGFGLTQELTYPANTSCLQKGESNSVWYLFKVNIGGTLNFMITPVNPTDDYDFVVYNLTNNTCADIVTRLAPEVRCNYSSTPGNTGLQAGFTGTSEPSAGPNKCAPMTVLANDVYVLMIDNFTSTNNGYTLTFGGTASITDNTTPSIQTVTASPCSPSRVTVTFSEQIQCGSIALDGSDFRITGPSGVTITSAVGSSCGSNASTTIVTLYLSAPITITGTYTITAQTGSDGNTILDLCDNTLPVGASRTFPVNFIGPSVVISVYNNTTCNNAIGDATAAVSGGTPPYSYSWNTTPVQTTATATGLAGRVYTVTVTDANGCTATRSVTISEIGAPTLSLVSKSNVSCYGNSDGTATVNATGGTAPYTYIWNTTPVQIGPTAAGLTPSTYNLIVTVTDANGCNKSLNVSISQPAQISVAANNTNANCGMSDGGSSLAVTGGTSPYSCVWSTTPVQFGLTATNLSAGIYTATITDANNCSQIVNVFIGNIGGPNASVVAKTNTICGLANGSVTMAASGGTSPYTYVWNTIPVQMGPTAINLAAGVYNVTVTDGSGCINIFRVKIDSASRPVASIASFTNATCGNADGRATASVSGGAPPYTYLWNTTPAQAGSNATGLPAGNYTVTITDANGCSSAASVVIDDPGGSSDYTVSPACIGEPVLFFGTSTTNPTSWFWDFGDPASGAANNSSLQNASHIYNSVGQYTVTLYVSGGCENDTIVKKVNVSSYPTASFSYYPAVVTASSSVSFAYTGSPEFSYYWDFGDGTTSTQMNAMHTYNSPGDVTVTLVVANAGGCADTLRQVLRVLNRPEVYLPNAFTPNGDGVNDKFCAVGRGVQEISMKIFNRWGQLIYETKNSDESMTQGWDGTQQGALQSIGVYAYHVTGRYTNGEEFQKTGSVILIR